MEKIRSKILSGLLSRTVLFFICIMAVSTLFVLIASESDIHAYERYNDGCQDCHGAFFDQTSPKGTIFNNQGNKLEMHRTPYDMETDCHMCHKNGDKNNPYLGRSAGHSSVPGVGCSGCHGREEDAGNDSLPGGRGAGLRQHHYNTGSTVCFDCHNDANPQRYTPVGEHVMPPYYRTEFTNADNPCNKVAQHMMNENWDDFNLEGLDNDGDGLYDGNDPDCQPDTLEVLENIPLATNANASDNVAMQRLHVLCSDDANGECTITSVSVHDTLVSTTGIIDSLEIHLDSDQNLNNGTLGSVTVSDWDGKSTVADLTSIPFEDRTVDNQRGTNVIVIYNLSASSDGSTIQSQVTAIGAFSPDNGASGMWDSNVITIGSSNSTPVLSVSEPNSVNDTVTVGDFYDIRYSLDDPDDEVTVEFYYDEDNSGLDGTRIQGACASAPEGNNLTCAWDTKNMTPGTYFVYGVTDDGLHSPVSEYSPGQITINSGGGNAAPTLTVDEPNGVADTVTAGDSYDIRYDLDDPDNDVTVAFYYDTDNGGLDGTAISGSCTSASEGSNRTCAWSTTGMLPGSYYVYGITDDGVNPPVDAYSSGQITINPPDCPDNDADGYVDCDGTCDPGGLLCGDCNDAENNINPSSFEICDNLDNNCDGNTDENLTRSTSCGVGECTGNTGTETCTAGTWGNDTCDPLAGATAETCDNLDNDCDGVIDDFTRATSCGVGECGSTGTETCTAGTWGSDTCTPGTPSAELCDGLDNNCDGAVDEDFTNLGTGCTAGIGACEATGSYICSADGLGTECDASPGTPGVEGPSGDPTCGDTIDNDCDGTTDAGDTDCTSGGGGTKTLYVMPSSGVNIANGIQTDHGSCWDDPTSSYIEELSTDLNDMCTTDYRYKQYSAGLHSEHYFNTAYPSDTMVTGVSYQFTIRDGGTFGIQLFYVTSGGSRTYLGTEVTRSNSEGTSNNYTVDLSGQSGIVPTAAKLGLRTRLISLSGFDTRVYLGNPDGRTGNISGKLIVNESAGGSPCPDNDSDGYAVCDGTCDPGGLLCGDCNDGDQLAETAMMVIS
jgi:hypothetical protein